MAEMIPDKLPRSASKGEERVFSILKRLPDDYIVYYEPIINYRYPDFVVICPDMGILIIEVKGWYPKSILSADNEKVTVKGDNGDEVIHDHPIKQARRYMFNLMDKCKNFPLGSALLHEDGIHKNKLAFPFGHFAVFSNITKENIEERLNLLDIFTEKKFVYRDKMIDWDEGEYSADDLKSMIQGYFDPIWNIKRMDENQIKVLRAVIHPETIISNTLFDKDVPKSVEDLKILDLRQENNALQIGDGHRIIFGVAGSGKTVLLIAKARLLSQKHPEGKILVLCFNKALSAYLFNALKDCPNVRAFYFHAWAKNNGVTFNEKTSHETLGTKFLEELENDAPHSNYFDAVLIDEAQDLDPTWFQCALASMKDPLDGDLIIVGDGSQGIYKRRKIKWKNIGIQARGRTINKRFDLDKNYRNSREIIELAAIFSSTSDGSKEDEFAILSTQVDPSLSNRFTGHMPVLIQAKNRSDENTQILKTVKGLLDGKWLNESITPLAPEDIAILYRHVNKTTLIDQLIESIKEIAPVNWLTDPRNKKTEKSQSPGVKIRTIHSTKGLQYKAVIVMWADLLPANFQDASEEEEKRLLYVALTRPEDYLVITASDTSGFIEKIMQSRKAIVWN